MDRKILQDAAHTLPRMLLGSRVTDDLEKLAELPDGKLEVDLLKGTARHSSGAVLELLVVSESAAWLNQRLDGAGVSVAELENAQLEVTIRTDRVPTDRKWIILFEFTCTCTLTGFGRTYLGHLPEKLTWYPRRRSRDA
jgi:hypothetical protein